MKSKCLTTELSEVVCNVEPQNFFYFSKYLILFVSVLVCNTFRGDNFNPIELSAKILYRVGNLLSNMLSYNLVELTECYKQLA